MDSGTPRVVRQGGGWTWRRASIWDSSMHHDSNLQVDRRLDKINHALPLASTRGYDIKGLISTNKACWQSSVELRFNLETSPAVLGLVVYTAPSHQSLTAAISFLLSPMITSPNFYPRPSRHPSSSSTPLLHTSRPFGRQTMSMSRSPAISVSPPRSEGGRRGDSASPPRAAERAHRACEKCTRTKKKCDKALPSCSRCTR
jgi:hypothetical protein